MNSPWNFNIRSPFYYANKETRGSWTDIKMSLDISTVHSRSPTLSHRISKHARYPEERVTVKTLSTTFVSRTCRCQDAEVFSADGSRAASFFYTVVRRSSASRVHPVTVRTVETALSQSFLRGHIRSFEERVEIMGVGQIIEITRTRNRC